MVYQVVNTNILLNDTIKEPEPKITEDKGKQIETDVEPESSVISRNAVKSSEVSILYKVHLTMYILYIVLPIYAKFGYTISYVRNIRI